MLDCCVTVSEKSFRLLNKSPLIISLFSFNSNLCNKNKNKKFTFSYMSYVQRNSCVYVTVISGHQNKTFSASLHTEDQISAINGQRISFFAGRMSETNALNSSWCNDEFWQQRLLFSHCFY